MIDRAEKQLDALLGSRADVKVEPKCVIVFSGHMIDNPAVRGPGKAKPPRFPADKVDAVDVRHNYPVRGTVASQPVGNKRSRRGHDPAAYYATSAEAYITRTNPLLTHPPGFCSPAAPERLENRTATSIICACR